VQPEEACARIAALGFSAPDTETLFAHFDDAERRGKRGHGYARIPWLETLEGLEPRAAPTLELVTDSYLRWDGGGALGYLTLNAVVERELAAPPVHAHVVVARRCFPTGYLGHYARRLAEGGLACLMTATSPARLAHPHGGPPLAGTNPLTIGVPSSDGAPVVADVSPAKATWGDVISGLAREEDVVTFGGEHAHKAFAIAVGLQLFADSLLGDGSHGAVLVVARPAADPVPALRAAAAGAGVRLPGHR